MVAKFNHSHTIADVRTYITTYPFAFARWLSVNLCAPKRDIEHKGSVCRVGRVGVAALILAWFIPELGWHAPKLICQA